MRTTLDIDDDVLQAARERARRDNRTIGQVISDLARATLTCAESPNTWSTPGVFGFHPFPSRGGVVSNELINSLRGDDVA